MILVVFVEKDGPISSLRSSMLAHVRPLAVVTSLIFGATQERFDSGVLSVILGFSLLWL